MIDFVASQSDLTVDALIKASSFDERAPLQILMFGLKATRTLKLPVECRVKEVLAKVLKERLDSVGDRIAHMKPMLDANGKLKWETGAYKFKVGDQSRITRIIHCSGDAYDVPAHSHLYADYNLGENWSDMSAYLQKDPMSQVVIADFFKSSKSGPWKQPQVWTGAGKACASVVASVYEDWLSTHEAPAHKKGEENNIAQRLTELEKGKKSDTLKRAREEED